MSSLYPERNIDGAFVLASFPDNVIGGTHISPYYDTKLKCRVGPRRYTSSWKWHKWRDYFARKHPDLVIGKSEEFWKKFSRDVCSACQKLHDAVNEDPSLRQYDMSPDSQTMYMCACEKCGVGMSFRDRKVLMQHCLCLDKMDEDRIKENVPCLFSTCGRWMSSEHWYKGANTAVDGLPIQDDFMDNIGGVDDNSTLPNYGTAGVEDSSTFQDEDAASVSLPSVVALTNGKLCHGCSTCIFMCYVLIV